MLARGVISLILFAYCMQCTRSCSDRSSSPSWWETFTQTHNSISLALSPSLFYSRKPFELLSVNGNWCFTSSGLEVGFIFTPSELGIPFKILNGSSLLLYAVIVSFKLFQILCYSAQHLRHLFIFSSRAFCFAFVFRRCACCCFVFIFHCRMMGGRVFAHVKYVCVYALFT